MPEATDFGKLFSIIERARMRARSIGQGFVHIHRTEYPWPHVNCSSCWCNPLTVWPDDLRSTRTLIALTHDGGIRGH